MLNMYIFVYQPHLPITDAEKIINWGGIICNHLYTFNTFRIREIGTSLEIQMENNLPAMQQTRIQSLNLEDPLEEGMATHSSILAWRVLWAEEPGGLQSMGFKDSYMT